jgi:hypothetical protein
MASPSLRESRRYPRQRTLREAKIVFSPDYIPIACVILDVSAWGARIRLDQQRNDLPKSFYVVPAHDTVAWEVIQVWQKGERFGLKIATKHDLNRPGSPELSQVRRSCA